MVIRPAIAALTAAAVLALTACTAGEGDAPQSPSSSPSPSVAARVDDTPGVFDLAEVKSLIPFLPVASPFEWTGGTAVDRPANAQFGASDFTTTPVACAVFYEAAFLRFSHDRETATPDTATTFTYIDKAGAGPDDDVYVAAVQARVLSDVSLAEMELFGPLAGAADECAGGYETLSNQLGWTMMKATAIESLGAIDGVASDVPTLAFRMDTPDGSAPVRVEAWALVDNLLLQVSYDVGGSNSEGTVDDALELVAGVINTFEE